MKRLALTLLLALWPCVAWGQTIARIPKPVPYVTPRDYGGNPNDSADDTIAFEAAIATQRPIILEAGTWLVERIDATTLDRLEMEGCGPRTIIKLKDDDAGGGLGYILKATNVKSVSLKNIKFDGNTANSKDGDQDHRLVTITQNVSAADVGGYNATVEGCEFDGSGGGWGHLLVQAYEASGSSYGAYETVRVSRCRFATNGGNASAVFIRGAHKSVDISGCYFRNDGQYGFPATNPATASGRSVEISSESSYAHYIENLRISNCYFFGTNGCVYSQMVANQLIENCTSEEDGVNTYYDVAAAACTFTNATNRVNYTLPAGYGNGTAIIFANSGGGLPPELTAGVTYFVFSKTASDFQVETVAGAFSAIDLTTDGTGTHTVAIRGINYGQTFKSDDCLFNADLPGRIQYKGVRVIKQSSHTTARSVGVEATVADTSVGCTIENSEFCRAVQMEDPHPSQGHILRDSTMMAGWESAALVAFGSNATTAISRGVIDNCYIENNDVVVTEGDTTYRNCIFAQGYYIAPALNSRLRLENNVFNANDTATGTLEIVPPTTGNTLHVWLTNNRRKIGATQDFILRISGSGDLAGMSIFAEGNDYSLQTGFSHSEAATLRYMAANNDRSKRPWAEPPFSTLTNSATPTVAGVTTCLTGGTTAITNFADGLEGQAILVYIASTHTVNDTASIVTTGNANIAGPAVARFTSYGSVWYQN